VGPSRLWSGEVHGRERDPEDVSQEPAEKPCVSVHEGSISFAMHATVFRTLQATSRGWPLLL
jgi:hypothetical protein